MGDRLKDRAAIVTGAGRGIGRGIALLLAGEGAAVVANDLGASVDGSGGESSAADQVVAEIRAAGGRAVASYDSVADFAAAGRIVDTAVHEFGRLDVLVNNAGILRDRMIFNLSEDDWDAVLRVHLTGTFNCTRHAAAVMREQRAGRIISMTSTSGLYGNSGQANYGAAKDGIAGFTRVIARDLGRYGVTANAIAPAAATRMTATVSDRARQIRQERGTALNVGAANLSLANMHPDDVAPFAVWLASDAARDVNGQTFMVMGGIVALLNQPAQARTITKPTRWTAEEIAAIFPRTLGMDLLNPAPPQPPK